MTYPDSPHYFSLEDDAQPTVNTVKLTEDETGRGHRRKLGRRCQALGVEPPDPLRALIAAAEHLFGEWRRSTKQATLEADVGVVQ